jgi:hypothetical protein
MGEIIEVRPVLRDDALMSVQTESNCQGMLGLRADATVDPREVAIDRVAGHDPGDEEIDRNRCEGGQNVEENFARERFHMSTLR